MTESKTSQVIQAVGRRLGLVQWGRLYARSLVWWSLPALASLMLIWVWPAHGQSIITAAILSPLLLAGLTSWFFYRAPTSQMSARVIDENLRTKDLFLTASELSENETGFEQLVIQSAEATAPQANAVRAVPFQPWRGLAQGLGAIAAVVVVSFVVPLFDPFGKIQAAQQQQAIEEELVKTREQNKARVEQLRREAPDQENSAEIERITDDLRKLLNRTKPEEVVRNRRELIERQKRFSDEWKERAAKQLNEKLAQREGAQQFGADPQDEMLRKMRKDLQKGKTDSIKEQLQKMEDELQRLSRNGDSSPEEKEDALQRLQRQQERLEQLAKEMGAENIKRAMQQMKEQLAQGQNQSGLSEQQLGAMQESLELSDLEFEQLAQSLRDMKSIEDALKAMQLAKKLNEGEQLDGAQCAGCETLADYKRMYEEMLKKAGKGGGSGDRGKELFEEGEEGQGRGGIAGEDNDVENDFVPEKSKSAMQAGKLLLSLKTKGQGKENAAVVDYDDQIRTVREGVSEAILREQVPPGYHDSIRDYFDALGAKSNGSTEDTAETP
ncbi:transposase [Calycomorphotria hydatis]|uniref:Uncharacterized protein n=1 Tax=Calycomorphotria hydatis TaxID=2528027 RepID=A0A517T8U0_9PLAN|nr:transposase [Calycomorphotria hydatis]QDT64801.1 hypothetical protein V22_20440 [Calycomorphotria hydatis]